MFENLSEKLDRAIKVLKGQGKITDINIAETVREIRRALIDADVNFKVAKEVTARIKEEAIGKNVFLSVSPGQLFTRIVYEELARLMGGAKADIVFSPQPPSVFLIAGLQGSGKTTFSAKLAAYLKKKGRSPLLVACDVYRPAALEQLKVLAGHIAVDVYDGDGVKDPVQIAHSSIAFARRQAREVVIIDTAGRLSVDEEMMREIVNIRDKVNPIEILFVVDSMTGQDAVNTARLFNERLSFTGVVLTKLDGDTRGGAALSIRAEVNKPIKFISTGEKLDALDVFHPERMAQRILGMGDVLSLVEKAQEQFDVEESQKLQEKLRKNTFNFEDFLSQLKQVKKMGSLKDLAGMIPGMEKQLEGRDIDEKSLKHVEAII